MIKKCARCHQEKPAEEFPTWQGGGGVCRPCHALRRKEQRRASGVTTKEKRNAYMRAYREANKESLLAQQRLRRKDAPLAALWRRVSARKDRISITRAEFMSLKIPKTCPILGIPITYDLGRDNIPSVDRIDPNRPYEIGNIVIISYRANMVKSIGSANEHARIAEWMRSVGNPPAKMIGGSPIGTGPIYLKFGRDRERV